MALFRLMWGLLPREVFRARERPILSEAARKGQKTVKKNPGDFSLGFCVEHRGVEPLTSTMRM